MQIDELTTNVKMRAPTRRLYQAVVCTTEFGNSTLKVEIGLRRARFWAPVDMTARDRQTWEVK